MKFIHIADMHFDTTFDSLKDNLGEMRRLEQRKIFNKIIEYIKENRVKYLFIAGDFYEQKYIRESTIEFINKKFQEIENTYIFISPGNHDPFVKNSFYSNYNWNKNVKIFKDKIEKISLDEVDIYGWGFTDYYSISNEIRDLKIENIEKINVLLIHGTLDGSEKNEKIYNPLSTNLLKSKGFDYIALGHVHKNNIFDGNNIIYPGSTIAMGFDELGEHGMVVGEMDKEKLNLEFIKLDNNEFLEYELDITEVLSVENLIEILNSLYIPENLFYKIILKGVKNFEVNLNYISKYIENQNILKIKDDSKIKYNIEEISKEISLRGFFVSNILEKQKNGNYNSKELEKALEIGLDIL